MAGVYSFAIVMKPVAHHKGAENTEGAQRELIQASVLALLSSVPAVVNSRSFMFKNE